MNNWWRKISKKSFSLIVTLVLVINIVPTGQLDVLAYVDALGNVIGTSVSGDTIELTIDNGAQANDDILEVQVCDDNIIRFNYRPNDIQASNDTPMLDPDKTWSFVGATIDTSSDPITITTSEARVEISKTPCRITIKDTNGTSLLWEASTGGLYHDGVRFLRDQDDNLYGIHGYNFTEGNGDILRNDSSVAAHAGEQGNAGGPFIWSTSGYGVLVDSDGGYPYTSSSEGKLEFYYGGTPTEGRRYEKEDVEYFIMLGQPKEIMGAYADITGETPMMPKWSLGFSNFEWGLNQSELESLVETYRAKNIPIDAFGLDYDWKEYGESNYGEFRWNTGNFPDGASTALKTLMDNNGLKMIGITKPRIVTEDENGNRTSQYYDAQAGNYWYPGHYEYQDYFIPVNVRSIDPYNSSARTWFWEHSEDAFDKGIVGWWNDETDKVSSGSAQYWFGNFTTLHLSQAIYEGQKDYATNRVWQTARTYYPGAQRYGTTLWSGDIGIQYYKGDAIDWTVGMQEQRATMLSSINLGQTKWGMDIGGFNQADGTTNNPSPELYAKWVAFGASVPVFRVHGNYNQQRQPWYYGNTAEEIAKYALQLRYSLMPYMYHYEHSAYEDGVGLVRPLIFDYPEDQNVANDTEAWMFGDYILSSPVVEEGQTVKSIYLPEGTWIDYNTGLVYDGEETINYDVDAVTWTDIPMFIKDGAIIPNQKVLDYIGEETIDRIMVDVFPSQAQTSFTYYEDDGDNYDYENGTFFIQELSTEEVGSTVNFDIGAKEGSYVPDDFDYLLKIHEKAGTQVLLNGQALSQLADLNALKASTGIGFAVGKDIYGDVTYVKVNGASTTSYSLDISGAATVVADEMVYEAEEASLSGDSQGTKATVNDNHANYRGSGFVDGFDEDGATVTFYPKVVVGGDYETTLRYANGSGTDQTISLWINGSRVEQIVLPNLGNWDTWSEVDVTVPLTKGHNALSYSYDSDAGDTGNVNIDQLSVDFDPVVAKYEAESAVLSGGTGTGTDHYYYLGTSFVNGFEGTGATATFQVYVPESGNYNVGLRYANGHQTTKTLSTYVNGADVSTAVLTSPSSNWNEWQELNQSLALTAGMNTIAYRRDGGDSGQVNIDRMVLSSGSYGRIQSEKNLLDNGNFERRDNLSDWTQWHPAGQDLAFGVDSGSSTNPPESPFAGNERAYMWEDQAYQQSIHQDQYLDNGNYRMSAWVRLDNGTPTIARAEITGYGGSQLNISLPMGGQWHYISSDFTVSSGYVDIGFYVNAPGYTVMQVDDVRLIKLD